MPIARFGTLDENAVVVTNKGEIIATISAADYHDTPNDELPLDYLSTAARFFISSSEDKLEEGIMA